MNGISGAHSDRDCYHGDYVIEQNEALAMRKYP